jgi:hypothetical protein
MIRHTFITASLAGAASLTLANLASAQTVQISNPNWNITLSDAGYADLLLDNTPGFEGREYLSGEWAAAVKYSGGNNGGFARWLEPQFIFPDWTTNSDFSVVNPIAATNPELSAAASTIANADLRIDMTYEMIDTITGMKLGKSPASAATGSSIDSNRYVLQQTYTITNISGQAISDLSLFQFLHALNGTESTYDNRNYAGAKAEYRYDTTQVAEDPTYAGSGSTFRDYIGFASKQGPVAFENGYYGIDTVDNHGIGKPSVGVHLAIEADALTGTDHFAPANLWVGGAQKYALGNLLPNQSASFDVLLSIRTGTVINTTGECSGSANGGSDNVGGVDYLFENVTDAGDFFAEYDAMDSNEIAQHVQDGDFDTPDFAHVGLLQVFELEFTGQFDGDLTLKLGYDPTLLPDGFDENDLTLYHFKDGAWIPAGGVANPALHKIEVVTGDLSPWALAVVPEPAGAAIMALTGAMALRRRRLLDANEQ